MAFVGDTALNSETPELKPKFSAPLRRQEAEFAGYRCSRRGCNETAHGPALGSRKDVADDEEAKAIPRGQGAHIYSSSPNGPRGQGGLNKDKLAGANNCLHVCPTCHVLIDSATSTYTVDILVEMKWLHKIITRVINSHRNLEAKLIETFGNTGSARYNFEEYLLAKNPAIIKDTGTVPTKAKIDDRTLNSYVNEFFADQKIPLLEISPEERQCAAKKLRETMLDHGKRFKSTCLKNTYVNFVYTLTAIKASGEQIHAGEEYNFKIGLSLGYSLFQRHVEKTHLAHKIGFDVSGSTSLGVIEFDPLNIKLSTGLNTAEFLNAAIDGAKIYYDLEAIEIVDGVENARWKMNKGKADLQWGSRHRHFSSLKSIYARCLNARVIANDFGINFLPNFNNSAPKGGVRPGDVSGLLAYGLTDGILGDVFKRLKAGSPNETIKLKSAWSLDSDGAIARLECYLKLSYQHGECNMYTQLFLVINVKESQGGSVLFSLPDNDYMRIDYILEMPKISPEGEVLRELESFLKIGVSN
ncbi:hypothetical protein [Pseudomonas syringae]|uniref:hypothetical protein n=1 Tax=Pseudomonas syringae TaxID=317 RepID=UPI001BD0B14C|nr:hypothetical protein [Pseudomonas syringae]QVI74890.1 hypothetical protein KHW13_21905 [Pseudomonas syringae]